MSAEGLAIIRTLPAMLKRHADELDHMQATAGRLMDAGHEWANAIVGALDNINSDTELRDIERAIPPA